jgi:hypothetical protein
MVSSANNQQLLNGLAAAERCSQVLAAALLDGQPDRVAAAAVQMQHATTALSGALQLAQRGGNVDRALQQRLHRLGQDFALQREGCLRRSAFVDRALNSIIPSSRNTTYSGTAISPYGKQARSSGAFGRISA